MSYAVEVRVAGETEFVSNAIHLPSAEEAHDYGVNLAGRWLAVVDWRVVESPEPPNYLWIGGLQQIEESGNDHRD